MRTLDRPPIDTTAPPDRSGPTAVDVAVAGLEAWFETLRGPGGTGGYGGPVAHWWQQSLIYTGAGLDWRYEGIITGYLTLWRRTGDERWLAKARRAGDDLVAGQLADGHYAASAFEINPATAGTPHEAACDVGLLTLALALREAGRAGWQGYAAPAERNLRRCYVERLWDADARAFRDDPRAPSFVPNKAATACEALFLLADLTGEALWVERYALPTLDRIASYQIGSAGPLRGAIAQNSFGARTVEKYFPLYVARCVPALLRGYRWSGDERYAECALRAMRWIAGLAGPDGTLPTVVYPGGQVNRYPSWIAPLGDILRAADAVRPHGFDGDLSATAARLLGGQDASGGIRTASGFGAQVGSRPGRVPDLRDLLHVAGWCDKAFRWLAGRAGQELPAAASAPVEQACRFRGKAFRLLETTETIEAVGRGGVRYRWRKGQDWAEIAAPEFWLR